MLFDCDDPDTTPIYAHKASDGLPFCSYGVDTVYVEQLDPPEESSFSTLEYIENHFYLSEGADDILDDVMPENIRVGDPPEVGTLYYCDGKVAGVDIELEHLLD